jgi:hypothetical protein
LGSSVPLRHATLISYDFGGGTFLPSLRALERPMAMACFGFVTFFPLRPLLSLPSFIAFISVSTSLLAAGEYFRVDEFFAAVLLAAFVAMVDPPQASDGQILRASCMSPGDF